jgi:surface polysaccharide O-acyltransferase-like enzyme
MSLSAFVVLRAAGAALRVRRHRISAIASVTFGIFLVHPLVLYPLQAVWQLPSAPLSLLVVAAGHSTVTIAASVALTLLLRRIPYIRAAVG